MPEPKEKRPRGRPPKPADTPDGVRLSLFLTPEDHLTLLAAAEREKIRPTTWMRRRIQEARQ